MTEADAQGENTVKFSIATRDHLKQNIEDYTNSEGRSRWTAEQVESIVEETEALIDAIDTTMRGNKFYDELMQKAIENKGYVFPNLANTLFPIVEIPYNRKNKVIGSPCRLGI